MKHLNKYKFKAIVFIALVQMLYVFWLKDQHAIIQAIAAFLLFGALFYRICNYLDQAYLDGREDEALERINEHHEKYNWPWNSLRFLY